MEENPTWLEEGWCGGCSGGPGRSQLGPRTNDGKLEAGNLMTDQRAGFGFNFFRCLGLVLTCG